MRNFLKINHVKLAGLVETKVKELILEVYDKVLLQIGRWKVTITRLSMVGIWIIWDPTYMK